MSTPYHLHLFEISIRGKDSKGNDVPLHDELVAIREEVGQYEVVPSDLFRNLGAHPRPPREIEPASVQGASDYLKRTYQLECRARSQREWQRFAQICREYLDKSFDARIKRAREHAMLLAAERLDGLKWLEIARTGPVRHVATAIVLAPDADAEVRLADLADELDPNVWRQSEIAAEGRVVESLVAEGFPLDRIERIGHLKLGFDIRAHRIADDLAVRFP